jgi:subtilase family serine protease
VWNWGLNARGNYDESGASSGGISSYYSIPPWQTNVTDMEGRGGSTLFRNIPDVAANADNVYEIYDNANTVDGIGGTSCAAPLWAGFVALVNQQSAANGGPNAGFINPTLYVIGAGPNYSACFHPVVFGHNTWSASPGLFYAMDNYNLCTGLGTMNGTNLINSLASAVPARVFLPCPLNAGGLTLNWTSMPGISYQLQCTSDLGANNWISFGSAITATGSVTSERDSFTNSLRFYRVLVR